MSLHRLKVAPEPFAALLDGRKRHEFRIDDRTPRYEVGDELDLCEWAGFSVGGDAPSFAFTGRSVRAVVTYLSRGPDWGIPVGYCVMSLNEVR